MARRLHNCSECRYLVRTSPGQRFLLCTFWSADEYPVPGAGTEMGYDYVIAHCHVQPEAMACPFFRARPRESRKAS